MKKNFKSITSTLQNIIKKYNLDESYAFDSIKNDWETIINKNIHKLVTPVKLENQILYLQVKTGYWKEEFDKLKIQIIEIVNSKIDPYKIIEIKFI